MKNNFLSKAYGGVTVARHKLNGLGLPRQWKVMTSTLLLLFTFAIENVWADEWTAAEIAAKEGSVNVGTPKNHLTVSSPGVTSVTNAKYAKISGSEVKRDGVEINGAATSGSLVETNVLSIKTDRGYKLVSPVKVNGHSSSTTEVKAAYVGWEGQPTNTFTLCNGATDWKFQKNSATTEPADNEITFSTTIRSIYIYKQIKTATDAYNSFGTSKTVGNGAKFYIASVTASAVLAPEIEGESQMFNDETITLVGYPAGGTWGVKAGDPGTITADGKLTATGNGTIHVTYTVDEVEGTKEIVAAATKTLVWNFDTKDVLPTTAGITATNVGGTFESGGQLKLGTNGNYAYIDLTSLGYLVTAAVINGKTGSTGNGKNIGFGSEASATQDGTTSDASESAYVDYNVTPTKSSSVFSVIKTSGTSAYIAKITLTVKKAVKHTLSYAVIPAGKATVTLSKTSVAEGGTATATYSDIDGAYEFDEWQISGTGASIDNAKANPVTVTMGTDDAVVTLKLKPATTKYDVTAATGLTGGSVATSVATEAAGETVTITATPAFRYLFGAWDVYKTGDPTTKVSVTETAGVYTFEMPAYPVTISATFTADSRKQILYLTSTNVADTKANDKLYAALNAEATYNVIIEAPASQTLTDYALVVLHESIGGTSDAAAVTGCKTTSVPVLNTKSYFYGADNDASKRWTWGAPNAGTSVNGATQNSAYSNITAHPLFNGVTVSDGFFGITDDAANKCMQPIGSFATGYEGYILATTPNAATPGGNGCAIHEIPAGTTARGATSGKYLMISVSNAKLNALNANGQKLFQNAAAYLMSPTAWVPAAAADDDATLKALSVSGLTLSPTFAAATVDYTVTKAYGADDPDVSDVTATPTADGASADVVWDGTNKKFTITVTALDATTKKTYTITVNEAEAPKSLSRVLFSNGFDAFIDNANHTVKAYYLAGQAAPTATTITAGAGTAGEYAEGKITVTGDDASTVDYIVTLEAVTPNTTTVAAEAEAGAFDGTEAWVKNGLLEYGTAAGYSAGDKWYVIRRLLKSGDAADDQRVIAGWVRSYFFVGNAYKFIMTVSNNTAIKYSIDGGEQVASNAATVEITLPAGNHMIEIVSNQSSGDCRLSAPKLVERPATYSVTYKAGEGTGDEVVDAFEYAAGDEVTVQANAFTAPANKKFNGWASAPAVTISEGKFEMPASNVVLTAQWKEYFTITYKDGETILGTEDVFTDATPAGIADPSKAGYDFAGWVDGEDNPVTIASLSATTTVYAKWTADPCPTPYSLSKLVLTSASDGTVTGYNNDEYAGEKVIGGLGESQTADVDPSHEGVETGYKLSSGGSAIVFATLKKGTFQVGDRVVVTITKAQDAYKVEEVAQPILDIYYGTDKNDATFLTTIDNVTAAGTYTYRLTAADVTAIGTKKGIGVFRPNSGRTQNPYVYSVEIKGCREWAIFHTLTFKNIDGTATIAAESLEESAYASTVAPVAPKIATKRFLGWAEATDGTPVDLTAYTITEDKILYAVYEDIVCPTTGTVYKFQLKTDLTDGKIFTSAPGELTLNTTDHLSSMVNGEVTVNLASDKNTNRVQFYDGKAIGFANGDGASITLTLDCALATGDEIRFINYAGSGNKMNLSDGAHSLELNGNNAETVQKITVNSDWNGADELTLTRGGNTPKLTYFEIYRPAKYDVSFNMMGHGSAIADLEDVIEGSKITAPSPAPTDADYSFAGWYKENTLENEWKFDVDVVETNTTLYAKWLDKSDATLKSLMYGSTEIELQAGVYEYNVELPSLTSSVPALTAVTNNPNATKAITNDDAFDGEGNASSTVEVTPEKEGAAHQTYTVNFTKLPSMPLLDVDNSIVWDFANAGTQNNAFTDEVLANFPGVTNDATFSAQTLKASGAKIKDGYLQGTPILFHATKAGLLRVEFANTGGGTRPYRYLIINGVRTEYKSNNTTHVTTAWIEVPAGDVTIEGECVEDANGACTSDNLNFYKIEFMALAHRRTAAYSVGELGTICLEDDAKAVGANVYELQGHDENGKMVFDQILSGEIEAGKPYLFQATNASQVSFYKKVNATHADDASSLKGMYGTFVDKDLYPATDVDMFYFSGTHIWAVKDFQVASITIPAHRCYVNYAVFMKNPVGSSTPLPGRKRMLIGVNGAPAVATGVENAAATDKPAKMLINGQLFILRGEKMYDAKGQLVK